MNHNHIDRLLKQALQANEAPSPDLIERVKFAANGGTRRKSVRGRKPLFRNLLIAALCLLFVVSATAFGTNFFGFGLQDMALPSPEPIVFEYPDGTVEEFSMTLISLQHPDTPEHAAAVAWQTFLNAYDIDATGGNWSDVSPEYRIYGAYSLEMVEKIREITAYYELSLLGEMLDIRTEEEFHASIAYGPFLNDAIDWFTGYQFESGTFQGDGQFGNIGFQLRFARRGVFDYVFLNVGDIADFTEWTFQNTFGMPMLLLQSTHASLIILETEAASIRVNILAGTAGDRWNPDAPPFGPSDLEHFANLIDFGQLRSEVPDLSAVFAAERAEMNEAASGFVGTWTRVRTELDDGTALPMSEESGVEISADRQIIFWYSRDFLEFDTTTAAADSAPVGWMITGEVVPISQHEFTIGISYMTFHYELDFQTVRPWELPFQYDPTSGLLRYTDWDGVQHVFTRES
ncbi:MAG: hypothetical protein FWD99_08930 [Oscillospiraceae bacterium]|nr:hypothetical protein [Oscillospiraceae bacterium]